MVRCNRDRYGRANHLANSIDRLTRRLHKGATTMSPNHAMGLIVVMLACNISRSVNSNAKQPGMNVGAESTVDNSIRDQGQAALDKLALSGDDSFPCACRAGIGSAYPSAKC